MASRPRPGTSSLQRLPGGERLGRDRAGIDQGRLRARARLAQPVAAGESARLPALVRPLDLGDGAGGEAQIDALAVRRLHQPEGLLHEQGQLVGEGGLVMARPGWPSAISGGLIDWWAPPSGPSVTPDGRRDQQEAGVLVAGVVERIEAAGDERIVDGADREQPGAEQVAGEAQRGEHQEQIVLGDAELDMLAGVGGAPFLRRGDLRRGEDVGQLAGGGTGRAGSPRRRDWSRR